MINHKFHNVELVENENLIITHFRKNLTEGKAELVSGCGSAQLQALAGLSHLPTAMI